MRLVPARHVIDQNEVIPARTDSQPGVSEAARLPDPETRLTPQGNGDGTQEHFPGRDVRRKRPPLLSFLLRVETLRRLTRVILLLVLDFIGVAGALYTAMALKLAVQGTFTFARAWDDTRPALAFAYLVDGADVRARRPVRGPPAPARVWQRSRRRCSSRP